MKKIYPYLFSAIGILLFVVAFVYFKTPAESLPHFMPGFKPGIVQTHFKHGVAAFLLGLGSFIVAWFQSAKA